MKTSRQRKMSSWLKCCVYALASLIAVTSPAQAAKRPRAAAAAQVPPACDWVRPGHMPFMGDVVGAVDHYKDIPAPVRAKLKERMEQRRYDEIVSIRRDSIVGNATYEGSIRQMHFADTGMCSVVTRSTWTPDMQERGLVYCESGECILVPTVCRNVSRITRVAGPAAPVAAAPPGGELLYEPPAAGPPVAAPPSALTDPGTVTGATAPFIDEALPPTSAGPFGFTPFYPYYPTVPGGLIAVTVPNVVPVPVPAIPEPHSLLLMLAGLAGIGGLAVVRRRGRR